MDSTQDIGKLNERQLEILKLFSRDLEDEDMLAIKRLITKYLADKLTKVADELWDEKQWTNNEMERLLNTHERTSYKSKN